MKTRIGEAGRQAAWRLQVNLLVGVIPTIEHGEMFDGQLRAELHSIAEALDEAKPVLGPGGPAVARSMEHAMRLLRRDEFDRQQALRLLQQAVDQLADITGVNLAALLPRRS